MIPVEMTIREMVALASNPSCTGDLYERVVKALENATGTAKMVVACDKATYDGDYWHSKIPAIKALRLATRMGLKDAKDWIEGVQYDRKIMYTGPLDPAEARKLCEDLKNCGCNCWIISA